MTYGSEGGANQSLVRSPEGAGAEYLPSFLPDSNERPFLAGYLIHAPAPPVTRPETAAVPELATLYQLLLGLGAVFPSYRKGGRWL